MSPLHWSARMLLLHVSAPVHKTLQATASPPSLIEEVNMYFLSLISRTPKHIHICMLD